MSADTSMPPFDSASPWGACAPGPFHGFLLRVCHSFPARVKALHRLTFALRKPVKYGVHGPLDVRVWGLRLRLQPRGNSAEVKLLFAPQYFDRAELGLLKSSLQAGATFIDVGANAGAYSFWAHVCMQGRGCILAVEPDPEMQRRLNFNVRTNNMTTVQVCPVALSDRQGEADLFVKSVQRGENTLLRERASTREDAGMKVERVVLDTLPQLLESHQIEKIDMLKIDIEGHEPAVLEHFFKHAQPSLWPRVALTEFKNETRAQIDALFVSRGYRCVLQNKMNLGYAR